MILRVTYIHDDAHKSGLNVSHARVFVCLPSWCWRRPFRSCCECVCCFGSTREVSAVCPHGRSAGHTTRYRRNRPCDESPGLGEQTQCDESKYTDCGSFHPPWYVSTNLQFCAKVLGACKEKLFKNIEVFLLKRKISQCTVNSNKLNTFCVYPLSLTSSLR